MEDGQQIEGGWVVKGGGRRGDGGMQTDAQAPSILFGFPSTRHRRERWQGGRVLPLRSRAELLSTEVTCPVGHDQPGGPRPCKHSLRGEPSAALGELSTVGAGPAPSSSGACTGTLSPCNPPARPCPQDLQRGH